jgi:hypothetical protein
MTATKWAQGNQTCKAAEDELQRADLKRCRMFREYDRE